MQRWYWETTAAVPTEITDHVNLKDEWSVTYQTEELSVGNSTVTLEDPDAIFLVAGHRRFYIEEDSADFARLYTGFTAARTYERGVFRTGAERSVDVDLTDSNCILYREVIRGSGGNRPAETDVERMQWAMTSGAASAIDDDTYLSTDDPVNMDAADYRGQYISDVVQDCRDASGKDCFIYDVDLGGGDYGLGVFYDVTSSDALRSDLRISNDLEDVDADGDTDPGAGEDWTWAASLDSKLVRDPSRVFSGVWGNYDGGHVYEQRAATVTEFADRDTITSWPNVKSSAKATARAQRYLITISTEEDVITTSIEVGPEHVNDARAGWAIECKFTHLPGYEEFGWMRIMARTVTFLTPRRYRITYTLSTSGPSTPAPSCTTILTGLTASDTGQVGGAGDDTHYAPLSVTPAAEAAAPSVRVTGVWAQNGLASIGHQPVSLNDDWTETHTSRPGAWDGHTQYPTLAVMGYNAADGGSASLSWAGTNPVEAYRSITVEIPTSETTPTTTGEQLGTGGIVTMDDAPVSGRLLIAYRFAETSAWSATPSGWTSLGQWSIDTSAVGLYYLQVCVKCADGTEGTSIALGNHSKAHWQFVQEWELT